jgi:predicted GNAT family acetyltransferase
MSAFAARAATLADLPVVCSWVDDADTLFYLHPRAQFPLTVAQLAEAFAARELNTVLLADGAPVAFANCYRHTPGECAMIGNVIVAPAWRGRGAARALLAAMAQQAIAHWQM